jgi:hypothetical protein
LRFINDETPQIRKPRNTWTSDKGIITNTG